MRYSFKVWALALVGVLVIAACGDDKKDNDNPASSGGSSPSAADQPDLTISSIEVLPEQPQANQSFALNVYVQNVGSAASDAFEVEISIRDVTRATTYPVGTIRGSALQPGENVTVFSSTDRRVNDSGSYQVRVELKPSGQDGSAENNTKIKAFTVQ